MNSGIYKLYFKDGAYYIGKSVDLTRRKDEHFRSLKLNKHVNENVQFTYLACGFPEFIVLETCSIDKLDNLEQEYLNNSIEDIKNYTCLNINLNAVGASIGVYNHNCYTDKDTIINVFSMLLDEVPRKEIIKSTKVSETMLADLATGRTHSWLKDIFKDRYTTYFTKPKKVYTTITNGRQIIEVTNIAQTARNLCVSKSNLYSLVRGDTKYCKEWYNIESPPKWSKVIYKDLEEITVTEYTNQSDLAKRLKIDSSHLNNLLHGRKQSCHGWKLKV